MKVVFPTSLHPNTTTVTSDLQDKVRAAVPVGQGETHPPYGDPKVLPRERLPVHWQACITLRQHRSEVLAS